MADEIAKTNKHLSEAVIEANAANRAKSEFLATMSHDLRTPLNAIIGFSEAIRQEIYGPVGNSKNHEYLDDISKSGHILLSLINDILDLSKIEAGGTSCRKQTLNYRAFWNMRSIWRRYRRGKIVLGWSCRWRPICPYSVAINVRCCKSSTICCPMR